jgi:autotransporter passenger strand-loop-strand repeat protein
MSGTNDETDFFTAGDLVLSVYGDGADDGSFGDNQASPIVLEEVTTAGSVVASLELPETTETVDGITENAISGEYGSSSEGTLELAANGESLTIAGYGVNDTVFNDASPSVFGTTALAQTTSVEGGEFTAVPRVIADISYTGAVDTSTEVFNVDNTNNPRSVATVDGTTFFLSGQGVKGDTTQGVFSVQDGSSTATPIDTATDTRTVEIFDGQLFVSTDSTQPSGTGTSNISTFGLLPTGETAPSVLSGISQSITLLAGKTNGINNQDLNESVNLSPENYFFANATTLYVADGGDPKEGGLGDGGLQKWTFNGSTWVLDYTLSAGLNLVADTGTTGTTGLIGLTGTVTNGTVELFATNATLGDLDQTFLFGITDELATMALPVNESFTTLETAAPDTNIRGISFAPSAPTTSATSTTASGPSTQSGFTVTSGSLLTVLSGGSIADTTVLAGGTVFVSAGGIDTDATLAHGTTETVLGSASGDQIDGTQIVSAATAVVSDETVFNGGSIDLFLKGAVANDITLTNGGELNISGNATANDTSIAGGGVLDLESAKSVVAGSLSFTGSGTLEETAIISAGFGVSAVISGFGTGDVIDLTMVGPGATLSSAIVSGNTVETVTSANVIQSFTFAGDVGSSLSLSSDGAGGEEIAFMAPPVPSTVVSAGSTLSGFTVSSGTTLTVDSGGTIVGASVLSGGFATVSGADSGSIISAGGNEILLGTASGDQVFGVQLISAADAVANSETVTDGGVIDLFLKGGIVNDTTISSGGTLNISGNATANDTVIVNGGVLDLQSPKSVVAGSLTFSGAGTLEETDTISAGFGVSAVISGFGAGDSIDLTVFGSGATLTSAIVSGNTVETVTSGNVSQSFTFAGIDGADVFQLQSDGGTGEEITATGSGGSPTSGGSGGSGGSATSGGSGGSGGSPTSSGSVSSGGSSVSSGATMSGVSVGSGNSLAVQSGGTAVSTTVTSGGSLEVGFGATATNTQVQAGGTNVVASGGIAVGTVVSSGGFEIVSAGGVTSGAVLETGGTEVIANAGSVDEQSGSATISVSGSVVSGVLNGGSVLDTGTGSALITGPATGAATVNAGGGSTTVTGAAGAVSVAGGNGGSLDFVGGTGAATVGGAGFAAATLFGGAGSGSSLLIGGTGNTLEVGTGANTGSTAFVAGEGNSTLQGGTGTQAQQYFTNPLGNAGTATITMNAGASTMIGGSGASSVTGGSGQDVFGFVDGHAAGTETIFNFNSNDTLAFGGYGYSATNTPTETITNGNDLMTLSDGTVIAFIGIDHKLF